MIASQRGKTRVKGLRECKEDGGKGEEGRKRTLLRPPFQHKPTIRPESDL